MDSGDSSITQLLSQMESGDADVAARLMESIYDELRTMARRKLQRERTDHTLQATALVHEAWMRVVGAGAQSFENRAHFFASAARAMRRILVDAARRHRAQKRGGEAQRVELEDRLLAHDSESARILEIEDTLRSLEAEDPRKGEIVNLRYFAGLSNEETAAALGVSLSTVEREWRFIRARLQHALDAKRDD